MTENYYFDIRPGDYDRFLETFDEKILPNLRSEGKSDDYVRWRSSAYLVDFLKQPDDRFSRFLPPEPAKKFAQEVYGQRIDLGIAGRKVPAGFIVDFVEPRADAYAQGLRAEDLILRVGGKGVRDLEENAIIEALTPLAGSRVRIDFLDSRLRQPHSIEIESREYYRQTVFAVPTSIPGIAGIEIRQFNRQTNEDMERALREVSAMSPRGLVLDLRGNPGGPPLAALLVSAFFLPNDQVFAYFEGKSRPRSDLVIPRIPEAFHFDWPMVVLVDEETGSAAELFSGTLQERGRALVIGTQTAGQVLLKSLFDLSDGSRLALVVARGHFPDGRPFPFEGVRPDEVLKEPAGDALMALAAKYLYLKSEGRVPGGGADAH
ncbi:MAG: hypothetical protein GX606_07585 [Elusimicrobia bacterium]|nr:hypothetical protein [Elusimicrobiota bacterium]